MLIVRLIKKDAPAQAVLVIGAAGSFAAVSTLLGSPILGAFLLMEVAGLAGPMMGVVLVPGLLAAGVGSLIFLGLNASPASAPSSSPSTASPPSADIQVSPVPLGHRHRHPRRGARHRHQGRGQAARAGRRRPPAACSPRSSASAWPWPPSLFEAVTDHGTDQVLFSGESALGPLILDAESWTVGP